MLVFPQPRHFYLLSSAAEIQRDGLSFHLLHSLFSPFNGVYQDFTGLGFLTFEFFRLQIFFELSIRLTQNSAVFPSSKLNTQTALSFSYPCCWWRASPN